jgi:hypothetical protein
MNPIRFLPQGKATAGTSLKEKAEAERAEAERATEAAAAAAAKLAQTQTELAEAQRQAKLAQEELAQIQAELLQTQAALAKTPLAEERAVASNPFMNIVTTPEFITEDQRVAAEAQRVAAAEAQRNKLRQQRLEQDAAAKAAATLRSVPSDPNFWLQHRQQHDQQPHQLQPRQHQHHQQHYQQPHQLQPRHRQQHDQQPHQQPHQHHQQQSQQLSKKVADATKELAVRLKKVEDAQKELKKLTLLVPAQERASGPAPKTLSLRPVIAFGSAPETLVRPVTASEPASVTASEPASVTASGPAPGTTFLRPVKDLHQLPKQTSSEASPELQRALAERRRKSGEALYEEKYLKYKTKYNNLKKLI